MTTPHPKPNEWRARAEQLAAWGAPETARVWTAAADELEAFERQREVEALPLAVAARESGYSAGHLSRLVNEGKLANVGRPGSPLIPRSALPKKPRTRDSEPSLAAEVLQRTREAQHSR